MSGPVAIGGTADTIEIGGVVYSVHEFTEDGELEILRPCIIDFVVVGGGGSAGSSQAAGGGGGGGVKLGSATFQTAGAVLNAVVGQGGSVQSAGGQSSFLDVVALGGGHGNSGSGASGGGGRAWTWAGTGTGGSGVGGQGHSGGNGHGHNTSEAQQGAGGGGGAGEPGQNGSAAQGGNGGDGLLIDLFGEPLYFGGGGGGGVRCSHGATPGLGGLGGGGNAGDGYSPGQRGEDGKGGGGGGGCASARGGRGVVLLRISPLMSISGTVTDENGNPCQRTVYAMSRPTDGSAPQIVAHGRSDPVTGYYELGVSTDEEVTRVVVAEDDDAPLLNDLVDRVIPG